MIEIIYDKDKDKEKQGTSEKNEHEVSVNLRLPKNIRQIGNPDGHKRIYMEDYVVTYLNYIGVVGDGMVFVPDGIFDCCQRQNRENACREFPG